jgi:hypothetical protein
MASFFYFVVELLFVVEEFHGTQHLGDSFSLSTKFGEEWFYCLACFFLFFFCGRDQYSGTVVLLLQASRKEHRYGIEKEAQI